RRDRDRLFGERVDALTLLRRGLLHDAKLHESGDDELARAAPGELLANDVLERIEAPRDALLVEFGGVRDLRDDLSFGQPLTSHATSSWKKSYGTRFPPYWATRAGTIRALVTGKGSATDNRPTLPFQGKTSAIGDRKPSGLACDVLNGHT